MYEELDAPVGEVGSLPAFMAAAVDNSSVSDEDADEESWSQESATCFEVVGCLLDVEIERVLRDFSIGRLLGAGFRDIFGFVVRVF